jgi:hypothetical protein
MLPPDCAVIAAIKSSIAGFVVREVLTDTPNDATAIFLDMKGARQNYDYYKDGKRSEEDFESYVQIAREEIIQDLQDPNFVRLVWGTAKEFGDAIFPSPKVTSAALRAKRLGWMQSTFNV